MGNGAFSRPHSSRINAKNGLVVTDCFEHLRFCICGEEETAWHSVLRLTEFRKVGIIQKRKNRVVKGSRHDFHLSFEAGRVVHHFLMQRKNSGEDFVGLSHNSIAVILGYSLSEPIRSVSSPLEIIGEVNRGSGNKLHLSVEEIG